MRRILAVLFIFSVLIGCGGVSRPPVTPICSPPQILVNGVCVDPVVPPPPPPPPPEVKPVPNKGSRVILLGAYGSFNSTKSNFEKQAKAIYDSRNGNREGFSGISTFLMASGTQVKGAERWPWLIKNGKAQLDKRNPEYYGAFREFIRINLRYHNDIEICFDNEYLNTTDFHPYISNDKGVSYRGCPRCLYDSIQLTAPVKNYWLGWRDINEPKNQYEFHLNDAIGKARGPWVAESYRIIAEELKANPDSQSKIFIRPRNEEHAYIDFDGHDNPHKSLGDRSEVLVWFREQAIKAGLKFDNKRIFFVVNRDVVGPATEDQRCKALQRIHADLTRPYGDRFGLDAIQELHGADAENRALWTTKCGVNPKRAILSTDGFGEHRKQGRKAFEDANKAALDRGDPFNDVLFEEGGDPGKVGLWGVKVSPFSAYQNNFDAFFEFHLGMIPR